MGTWSRTCSLAEVERVAGDGEPGQLVAGGAGVRRVVEVEPAVRGEGRVERDAEQAVLVAGEDRDRARGDGGLGAGLDDLHPPVPLHVEHPAVGRDVELHRVLGVAVQRHLLEPAGQRRAAVRGERARRGPDAAEQVGAELRVREGLVGVPAAGVPGPAAVVRLAPGDRVVVAHRAAARRVRGLVEAGQHVRGGRAGWCGSCTTRRAGSSAPAAPAVDGCAGSSTFTAACLVGRVRVEVGADEVAVPGPVVLGVGRRVHARVAAAGADVALERGLLRGVEHVAGGGQPHDGLVLREVGVGEGVRVLGRGDGEIVGGAELLDRRDAGRDRVVPEPGRLGEDQHVERGGVGGGRDEGACRERRGEGRRQGGATEHGSSYGDA